MWSLQYFVNEKHNIISKIKNIDDYRETSMENKAKVRDILFKNRNLINEFIQKNPYNLPKEDIDIISKWENFIDGSFFIERYLKKQTIFIKDSKVYAVIGLSEYFHDIIHPSHLPIYIKAILLPFKGRIIYDGLLYTHNVHFGRNIREELKEKYMNAKKKKQIIERI